MLNQESGHFEKHIGYSITTELGIMTQKRTTSNMDRQ